MTRACTFNRSVWVDAVLGVILLFCQFQFMKWWDWIWLALRSSLFGSTHLSFSPALTWQWPLSPALWSPANRVQDSCRQAWDCLRWKSKWVAAILPFVYNLLFLRNRRQIGYVKKTKTKNCENNRETEKRGKLLWIFLLQMFADLHMSVCLMFLCSFSKG